MRYPFLESSKRFLDSHKAYFGENTLRQRQRDLRLIARDLWTLKRNGKITTTKPEKLTAADISDLILYWRTRPSRYGKPIKPQTLRKYIGILEMFLIWNGNPVITNMRRERKIRIPTAQDEPIEVLSQDEILRLKQTVETWDGWNGSVSRLLINLLPYSGLRPKEIRLAKLIDLDTNRWRIRVSHPKGEGAWASEDYAPILPPARQAVIDFLQERQQYLSGDNHEALIPLKSWNGTFNYWSDAMLHKLKGRIQRESGVKFHLKTFRATFAQMAKDYGVSIEAVSKALRHKTTKTTELYYARIRSEKAFDELERAFEAPICVLPK